MLLQFWRSVGPKWSRKWVPHSGTLLVLPLCHFFPVQIPVLPGLHELDCSTMEPTYNSISAFVNRPSAVAPSGSAPGRGFFWPRSARDQPLTNSSPASLVYRCRPWLGDG